jgi:glyoxylase-like metal-dependent hydrolase (beta-lactamase superfamily II)
VDRRELFRCALAGTLALKLPTVLRGQTAARIAILDSGGANVVAFSANDNLVLVDSGAPGSGAQLDAALKTFAPNGRVQTLFNTHYHLDQTGNNETFSAAGAKIIAHERTRQWMSTDTWVPDQDRYEKARPKAAWPTQTFLTTSSMRAGSETIEYGYLTLAHTSGDIYVHFRDSNVLAVGDVASPLRDPALDYFTGAWIGGRVDAMDVLLKISNDQTKIVPAYGAAMARAQLKAERDVMEEVRVRLFNKIREGAGPKDMMEAGLLNGLSRTWKDPYKFLYDASKGLWAHHNKIDPNVV